MLGLSLNLFAGDIIITGKYIHIETGILEISVKIYFPLNQIEIKSRFLYEQCRHLRE